jgi:prostaglandin-H2 D-isomerase / glutathione transferase
MMLLQVLAFIQAYKLHYFDILGGGGEPIRNAFKIAGVDFEDNRIQFSEWASMKNSNDTWLYKQLPILEIDNEPFAQSAAILRYVGKVTGLYPADPMEALMVDEIMDCFHDIRGKLSTVNFLPEDMQKTVRDKLIQEYLVPYYERIEKRISTNFTGFVVGDDLTIADLVLFNDVTSKYFGADGLDMDKYPTMKQVAEAVQIEIQNLG